MDNSNQKKIILNESIWHVMLKLSWPAVVAMVLYGLNTIFDAIFVGRFVGETALAGISLAYPLSQLSLGLGSLVGVGAGSALSIALGANDHLTQKRILGNMNYLNIMFGIGLTVLGLIFCKPLVIMMGGSGQALIFGADYFRITLFGSIFWITGLSGNMVVRSEGKMGTAAIMMGIGLVVNIIANYFFIVILKLGVKGAAWGTNIGMLVYTIIFFIYASSRHISFEAKPFALSRDKTIIKIIMSNGIPSLIMTIMTLIQGIVVLNALNLFGTTSDIAFYGIVYRLFLFMLTPIFGLMRALQPVVGINFGAEKYSRVIKSFKVFGITASILMVPFWALMMVNPELVLHLMLPTKDFLASDITNFRFFMALLPVLPLIFMAMTFFPSINKGKAVSIMGIVRQLVLYVPVMLILPKLFGVQWIYIGSFLIDLLIIIWVLFMVTSEFRHLRKGDVKRPEVK